MSNAPAFDPARRGRALGRFLEREAKRVWQMLLRAAAYLAQRGGPAARSSWSWVHAHSAQAWRNSGQARSWVWQQRTRVQRGWESTRRADLWASGRIDALPQRGVRIGAAAVAVVAVVGVITYAVASNVDRKDAPVAAPPTAASTPANGVEVGTAYVSGVSDGRDGRTFALVNGEPLFPLPNAALASKAGQPVEMQSIAVQQVVPGVGLWVGDSAAQRVFVIVSPEADATGTVKSANVQPGQLINVSGRMTAAPGGNPTLGIPPELGGQQAAQQFAYVAADNLRVPTT